MTKMLLDTQANKGFPFKTKALQISPDTVCVGGVLTLRKCTSENDDSGQMRYTKQICDKRDGGRWEISHTVDKDTLTQNPINNRLLL